MSNPNPLETMGRDRDRAKTIEEYRYHQDRIDRFYRDQAARDLDSLHRYL